MDLSDSSQLYLLKQNNNEKAHLLNLFFSNEPSKFFYEEAHPKVQGKKKRNSVTFVSFSGSWTVKWRSQIFTNKITKLQSQKINHHKLEGRELYTFFFFEKKHKKGENYIHCTNPTKYSEITSRATPESNNDSSGRKSKITKTSPEEHRKA